MEESTQSSAPLPDNTALILIDVQKGFDDDYWGTRNNPQAEQNMAVLLDVWRERGWPIFHVHHYSKNPKSPLFPDSPGNEVKEMVRPAEGETVIRKRENSAFIGTDLEAQLRASRLHNLLLAGLTTDHCVSTTARMAANLGFKVTIASDATATFDRYSPITSRHFSAAEIHESELTSLNDEFASVVSTGDIVNAARNSGETTQADGKHGG